MGEREGGREGEEDGEGEETDRYQQASGPGSQGTGGGAVRAQQAAEPTEVWAWLFSELLLQPLRKRRLCPHLAKLISELIGQESFSRAGPCLEVGGKQGQLSPLTLTTAPDKAGWRPTVPAGEVHCSDAWSGS